MGREHAAAAKALPVRQVPSVKPRDPAVDDPDYVLISQRRLDDLIDFLLKNKALLFSRFPRPAPSVVARFPFLSLFHCLIFYFPQFLLRVHIDLDPPGPLISFFAFSNVSPFSSFSPF